MSEGEKIYHNIKNEMKKKGVNQSDIAKNIGVTRANVSIAFSRMKMNKISYKTLIKIAKALKCDHKIFLN